MSGPTHLAVCCVSSSAVTVEVVRESVARALPSASWSALSPEEATPGKLPSADCVVIDATEAPVPASEMARGLRAGGTTAALVLVVAERDDTLVTRLAGIGALEQVPLRDAPRLLGEAIERALGGSGWSGALDAVQEELRRTQRLVAAGEIALGLQHAMNNPLTAMLAEAQLLEMDAPSDEVRTAVKRIIDNTRRLVQLVRGLDPIGSGRKP